MQKAPVAPGGSFDQLVYEIHAAGTATEAYAAFLHGAERVIPGFGFGIYRFEDGADVPREVYAKGVPDSFLARYEQEGRAHDPVLRRVTSTLSAMSSDLDLSAREWRGGPLFELVRSVGIARTIQAPLVIAGEFAGTLNVAGSGRQGAFANRDRERVALIARHLALALARTRREAELGRRCAALETALESIGLPLVVSDLDRQILFANPTAEGLAAADGERVAAAILLNTEELRAGRAGRRLATRAMPAQPLAGAPGNPDTATPAPALTVRSIRCATTTVVSFVYRRSALAPALATLSPREREIVAMVARGLTNDEIAAAAAISRNTVKHHLKRTFRKLQVRSRAELAAKAVAAGADEEPQD